MCGRFFLESSIEDIFKYYEIKSVNKSTVEAGERCPGTNIPVVVGGNKRSLKFLKWGYRIYGLKEIVNARIETIHQKETFKGVLQGRRCIVPANAFFEWNGLGKNKVKYKMHLEEHRIFSMAAIYNRFINENNEVYEGFAILTKPSYGNMAEIHHRMPVILERFQESQWLDSDNLSLSMLNTLCENKSDNKLAIEPVSRIMQLDIFHKLH